MFSISISVLLDKSVIDVCNSKKLGQTFTQTSTPPTLSTFHSIPDFGYSLDRKVGVTSPLTKIRNSRGYRCGQRKIWTFYIFKAPLRGRPLPRSSKIWPNFFVNLIEIAGFSPKKGKIFRKQRAFGARSPILLGLQPHKGGVPHTPSQTFDCKGAQKNRLAWTLWSADPDRFF